MTTESNDMKGYSGKFLGTIIAALVLVLIVGYLYFFPIRKADEEEKQRGFPTLNEGQITEIDLKYPSYKLACRKDDERWFVIVDSKKFKADDKVVSNIAETISQMKVEKVVSEDVKELAGFGLDSPELEVNIKTPGKKYDILIGSESPTGSGRYIRVDNESRIILVNEKSVEGYLRRSANDLRDKRIVSLEKVGALEIERGDTRISITKKGNNWEVDGDEKIRVDESKVQELLKGIEALEAEKFVDDDPNDLAPYGLDNPQIRIAISDAKEKQTLLFGKKVDKKVYAKLVDAKSVYLVGEHILSKIPSSQKELLTSGKK